MGTGGLISTPFSFFYSK